VSSERDETEPPVSLFCARCAAELKPGEGDFYRINVEAMADPTPPEVSEEDMATDHREQMERLLGAMNNLSEREAMDQVYRRLTFHLCGACYRTWIEDPAASG